MLDPGLGRRTLPNPKAHALNQAMLISNRIPRAPVRTYRGLSTKLYHPKLKASFPSRILLSLTASEAK